MSNSIFLMTRRRKIALLISVIAGLFVVAALSSYYTDETSGVHQDFEDQRALKLRSRRRNNAQTDTSESRTSSRDRDTMKQHSHSNGNEGNFPSEEIVNGHNQNKGHRKPPTKRQKEKKKGKSEPAISVKMAANTDDRFDANRVLKLFSSCRKEDDEILIDCYVDAYEELCKLFKAFGTVFGFVTSDVVEKIGILREYRKSPEAEHYATIQSLLSYEVEKGTTDNKKKASGSRTLLRLHRALEFIEELLVKIRETDNKDKFSTVASKAYDDTLAKHHAWLVKKAVHVAMYILPSRMELLKKMHLEDTESGMTALKDLIDELKIIYKITQDLYAKDKLLDLP